MEEGNGRKICALQSRADGSEVDPYRLRGIGLLRPRDDQAISRPWPRVDRRQAHQTDRSGNADQQSAWCDDAAIARWLHETAVRLHPESRYARTAGRGRRGQSAPPAELRALLGPGLECPLLSGNTICSSA